MAEDHAKLLRNALDWVTDEPRPVEVEGPGMFDVTAWKQKHSMTVHLVDLTNPMAMRPNFHELIPSHPQRAAVRLPQGTKATQVHLVVADRALAHEQTNCVLKLVLPSVLAHEVVAIDLD